MQNQSFQTIKANHQAQQTLTGSQLNQWKMKGKKLPIRDDSLLNEGEIKK